METQSTTLHNGCPGRRPLLAVLMRLLWATALVLPAFGASAALVLDTIHSFQQSFPNGANPTAALVQGSDGNFYGTTSAGGTNNSGTVFKIGSSGALTSLYSFSGTNDGAKPVAALVQGSDGNFYGTTSGGGTYGYGTIFKVSTGGTLTSLDSFNYTDGANPAAGLVQGSDGSFYGTTGTGGANSAGTVFKISPNGTFTSLYSFTGGDDGGGPNGLVQGSDGYFYGTTTGGGAHTNQNGFPQGTVFKITANGALTTLYSFTGGTDGAYPDAGLARGSDGSFYGTTHEGGPYTYQTGFGYGTVFKISSDGALTSLYSFTGRSDGAGPEAALVQGTDGYFYGTTIGRGANDLGTVFKISTNGTLTSLYSFTGTDDGANPTAALVEGSDGDFYGTSEHNNGLNQGPGTVFKISSNGALTSLYFFSGGPDGANPGAGLVEGSDGNFYGTTTGGGTKGWGTVFKISPNGTFSSLYSFTGGYDGGDPQAALVQGSDGNFYGTAACYDQESGTHYGYGTVFTISSNGAMTTLYSFGAVTNSLGNALDGEYPAAALVEDIDGNFYGTTPQGGRNGYYGYGTVFKISSNGTFTSLYYFGSILGWVPGGAGEQIALDGANPACGLVQGRDGSFYGTTVNGGSNSAAWFPGLGTVFEINTNGALTTLYAFGTINTNAAPLDGYRPSAALVQGSDGNFYGTTSDTVFQMTPGGVVTTLATQGSSSAMVQGRDGNFYGTSGGTVFKISPNGTLNSLYSFTGGDDGGGPNGLVQGRDGNFYGTTSQGGAAGAGTVFRLTIVPAAPVLQAVGLTNGTLNLTWRTEAGWRYQPQFSTDLGSSNWVNLGGPLTAAGATLSATGSVTNDQRRFYRVVLSP